MDDKKALHDRIMILRDMVESGRLKFMADSQLIESLLRVEIGSDGLVDPATVNSDVRATALAAMYFHERDELKTIPLRDIQAAYFKKLESTFGSAFSLMKKHGANERDTAAHLANDPRNVQFFTDQYPAFAKDIISFWENASPIVYAHLEDMQALKSVFGGDIFPSYLKNIASSVGLYMDTLILSDPMLRTTRLAEPMKPEMLMFYVVKHALNVMKYRDLALADVDPPIVVIAPDYSLSDETLLETLTLVAKEDMAVHISKIFGQKFDNEHDADIFLGKLAEQSDPLAAIVDSERLLFDTEWTGTLEEKIKRHLEDTNRDFDKIRFKNLSNIIKMNSFGRMLQANEVIASSVRYKGTPLIDAPTSWQYLNWKYEYDLERSKASLRGRNDLLISRVLGTQNSSLLSNIPIQALIELRKAGALAELRKVLRQGIELVDNTSDDEFNAVSEHVISNLSNALLNHHRQVKEFMDSRKKFYGFDVAPWIAIGGIQILGAATGNPVISVAGVAVGLIGLPSARDLVHKWKQNKLTANELRRSPIGILIRYSK